MKNDDHVWRLKSPRWQRQFPAQTKSIITSCEVLYAWDDLNVNIEIIWDKTAAKRKELLLNNYDACEVRLEPQIKHAFVSSSSFFLEYLDIFDFEPAWKKEGVNVKF